MASRLILHEKLKEVLGSDKVFFQPPESVKLSYPCIIYNRANGDSTYANDMPYTYRNRYQITIIGRDPDEQTTLVERMAMALPTVAYEREFVSDNLYHDVFELYH